MKLLTWNILADEWIEPEYYPECSNPELYNRNCRFDIISKILIETDADVMLLQEVMQDEYMKLCDLFSDNFHLSPLFPIQWSLIFLCFGNHAS
jgi:mRNA deadenylase 3'-5' endonuclease subunit Ccr4